MKELRTLIIEGERRPTEGEILEAQTFARTKKCIVELRWFIPHSGWKARIISEETNIEELALICIDSYPLGFGKVHNHQIKNLIDKGWIIR